MGVQRSVSTWQQPTPGPASPERSRLIESVAERVLALGEHRLRVVIDGRTASGKTSFGHELADRVGKAGRQVLRATLDDFKKPWADRDQYDRTSGEGYYRNAYDYDALRRLLLDPHRSGAPSVALCSIDPVTQENRSSLTNTVESGSVLIADGVFAFRPEINEYWDLRIWLDIPATLSKSRGYERDRDLAGSSIDAAQQRYQESESIYVQEVNPSAQADLIIENSTFAKPII